MIDWAIVGLFALAFARGVRVTRRLHRIHQAEKPPRNYITFAFWVVAAIVTAFAGVIGFLGARRVAGYEPFPAGGLVTLVLATAVLFIPDFLDWTVRRIRRRPVTPTAAAVVVEPEEA